MLQLFNIELTVNILSKIRKKNIHTLYHKINFVFLCTQCNKISNTLT